MFKSTPSEQESAATGPVHRPMTTAADDGSEVLYPLQEISVIVKTYSHDLRNTLNGMDLDLTLINEATSNPNTQEAIKRLKATAAEIGRQVQGLASKYVAETPFEIPVVQIAEKWKLDVSLLENCPPVRWSIEASNNMVHGEAGLIRNLLWEMLLIAQRVAPGIPLSFSCACGGGKAVFGITTSEAPSQPRRVQLQLGYWEALRHLAERVHGKLLPSVLDENGNLSLQLILPSHPLAISP